MGIILGPWMNAGKPNFFTVSKQVKNQKILYIPYRVLLK
jgi:hypothetical protein